MTVDNMKKGLVQQVIITKVPNHKKVCIITQNVNEYENYAITKYEKAPEHIYN